MEIKITACSIANSMLFLINSSSSFSGVNKPTTKKLSRKSASEKIQDIVKNEKVIFGEYKNMQMQSIPVRVKAQFPEISVAEQQKKIAEYQKNFEENLSVESFSMVEIQMFFSVALVVTLLVYIANQKRQ